MPRGKAHSDEVRAEVMAALLAGLSVSDVARKYALDKSVVSRIRASLDSEKLQQVATENEIRIDQHLAEALQAHLKLQQAIATVCANENYLREQTASDIADLLKVSQDHSVRLLEAASNFDEDDSSATEEAEGA